MRLESVTFCVTDSCNFSCHYCSQKKGKQIIDPVLTRQAIDFFLPFLKNCSYVNFYGGEPLLAFDRIRYAVNHIEKKKKELKKKIFYSISTNGSLLTDDKLRFLDKHRFSILLSFDGLAQDITRKKGSFRKLVSIIGKIKKYDNLDCHVNAVFTSDTVELISASLKFLMDAGVPDIFFSLSTLPPWNATSLNALRSELGNLNQYALEYFKKNGELIVSSYSSEPSSGLFGCFAGKDRLALTPEGLVWGCHVLAQRFKDEKTNAIFEKYCFGKFADLKRNFSRLYERTIVQYKHLSQNHFYSNKKSCLFCSSLSVCRICPFEVAKATGEIGKIPDWICECNHILYQARKDLREKLNQPLN